MHREGSRDDLSHKCIWGIKQVDGWCVVQHVCVCVYFYSYSGDDVWKLLQIELIHFFSWQTLTAFSVQTQSTGCREGDRTQMIQCPTQTVNNHKWPREELRCSLKRKLIWRKEESDFTLTTYNHWLILMKSCITLLFALCMILQWSDLISPLYI